MQGSLRQQMRTRFAEGGVLNTQPEIANIPPINGDLEFLVDAGCAGGSGAAHGASDE